MTFIYIPHDHAFYLLPLNGLRTDNETHTRNPLNAPRYHLRAHQAPHKKQRLFIQFIEKVQFRVQLANRFDFSWYNNGTVMARRGEGDPKSISGRNYIQVTIYIITSVSFSCVEQFIDEHQNHFSLLSITSIPCYPSPYICIHGFPSPPPKADEPEPTLSPGHHYPTINIPIPQPHYQKPNQ
jgi:hypothetical protein